MWGTYVKNHVSWIWRELFRLAGKWKKHYTNPHNTRTRCTWNCKIGSWNTFCFTLLTRKFFSLTLMRREKSFLYHGGLPPWHGKNFLDHGGRPPIMAWKKILCHGGRIGIGSRIFHLVVPLLHFHLQYSNENITNCDSWGIFLSSFAALPPIEKNPIPTSVVNKP